jgi:hypothetical protein
MRARLSSTYAYVWQWRLQQCLGRCWFSCLLLCSAASHPQRCHLRCPLGRQPGICRCRRLPCRATKADVRQRRWAAFLPAPSQSRACTLQCSPNKLSGAVCAQGSTPRLVEVMALSAMTGCEWLRCWVCLAASAATSGDSQRVSTVSTLLAVTAQSNAKQLWANTKPMDAEKRMVTQAVATKAANPDAHVWVCEYGPILCMVTWCCGGPATFRMCHLRWADLLHGLVVNYSAAKRPQPSEPIVLDCSLTFSRCPI